MTILLDLENNIINKGFAWWVENFKLDYVSIIDGEVNFCSDMDIPCVEELDEYALSLIAQECTVVA